MRSAREHLLQAAMLVSPTGKEQRAFTAMVHEMDAAAETELAVCTALSGAITDGLRYGNWPPNAVAVRECEGHESLAGQHMGEAVYCDGSCR